MTEPCCTILMNDHAGRFRSTTSVEDMRKMLDGLGLNLEVVGTKSEEEMVANLRRAVKEGREKIAIAGGDGTIHTAIQTLAGTETALGIVPQGTINNFATSLRLPLDLPSALRTLHDGEVKAVDLGYACNMYFAESAGVGIFANALSVYGADANKNLLRGLMAFMKIMMNLKPSRVMLTVDGERHEEPAIFCAAMNTFRIAQGFAIAPGARLTDGKLDVVILGNLSRRELVTYYRAIRQQTHPTLPKTKITQASHIKIEARRKLPVHVDDKVRGSTPVEIEARPGALKVVLERL